MDQALNKIATVPLHRKCFNHLGTLGNDITVQQLLDHRKGFNRDASGSPGDVVFEMRQISQKLGSNSPPSIQDFAAYMRGFRLDFTPDTEYQYSNVGYIILSAVVERISGQKYFDYLKSTVLAGSYDVRMWHTDPSFHVSHRVTQEASNVGPTSTHCG
jgi:hypothetical protein